MTRASLGFSHVRHIRTLISMPRCVPTSSPMQITSAPDSA